jgi:DNA helicase-4
MFRRLQSSAHTHIESQATLLQQILDHWSAFCQQQTYMTAGQRYAFQTMLASYQAHQPQGFFSSLFRDATHTRMHQESLGKLAWLAEQLQNYNDRFIFQRLQEHASFFDGTDDHLSTVLDAQQRRAIITDDQHNLVIAGAGSGKTSVLTSRIAYLTRRADAIAPERILALAFNRSAAQEMRERLQRDFHLDLKVATFHSFCREILLENQVRIDEVADAAKVIGELFPALMKTHTHIQELFLDYLQHSFRELANPDDFATKAEYYDFMSHQRYLTLNGIEVKSLAECELANFFFAHNIEFRYEAQVTWLPEGTRYRPDFYLPQYDIYIEHWGIDRQGHTAQWIDEWKYKRSMDWKRSMFQQYNKTLLETWQYEYNEGTLLSTLQRALSQIVPSLRFEALSYAQLVEKVYATQHDQIQQISTLIATWILHAKSHFFTPEHMRQRLTWFQGRRKDRIFGELALLVYQEYEHYLRGHHQIDFHDMINQAIALIKQEPQRYGERYDHILVDEFQDISFQRLELLRCFVNGQTRTKIFCVGDDWQSIYRFAGSEVSIFIQFEHFFPAPATTLLHTNYRCVQSIVDASSRLISFNREQRPKQVVASNREYEPITLYTYRGSEGVFFKAQTRHVLRSIKQLLAEGVPPEEIMVLSRFHRPLQDVQRSLLKEGSKSLRNVRCLSVHQAKGSQAT